MGRAYRFPSSLLSLANSHHCAIIWLRLLARIQQRILHYCPKLAYSPTRGTSSYTPMAKLHSQCYTSPISDGILIPCQYLLPVLARAILPCHQIQLSHRPPYRDITDPLRSLALDHRYNQSIPALVAEYTMNYISG